MPLSMADTGKINVIQKIRGKNDTVRFLANLGFVEGSEVTVISASAGNLIVQVKDCRVALSQSLAMRIMV
ncbi:MAG: FeoA family protein [Eubacteriales bacterium]